MKNSGSDKTYMAHSASDNTSQSIWHIDTVHSSVGFSVRYLDVTIVAGVFEDPSAMIMCTSEDFSDADIRLKIPVKSLNTRNIERDNHLKSADFFEAETYPDIVFTSTSTEAKADHLLIFGDLMIKGVSKQVTLKAQYKGTEIDPWGNTKAGFTAKVTINRQDFGVNWSQTLQSGRLLIGNEVEIIMDLLLIKK